ncbi:hypothetical protein KA005_74075 [bacterium]|nr:hypothetical protein [bacterium]
MKKFNKEKIEIVKRYLAGNSRWEVRGKYYAIRREKTDGGYKTTVNGFYSSKKEDGWCQTRVILSFGQPYGFGRDRGNITRIEIGKEKVVDIIIEGPHSGVPGHSSYVIFAGEGLNLEIYEQTPKVERAFTKSAYYEVSQELREVLRHAKDVEFTGIVPIPKLYPIKAKEELTFEVKDGMQPGIFLIEGWINLTEPGDAYVKVFETKTGKRLSKKMIILRSTRMVSWSNGGNTFFPYNARVVVDEGDWNHQYEARFELWHKAKNGKETKLAEKTRMIHGWQR